jgi:hypothetical protein
MRGTDIKHIGEFLEEFEALCDKHKIILNLSGDDSNCVIRPLRLDAVYVDSEDWKVVVHYSESDGIKFEDFRMDRPVKPTPPEKEIDKICPTCKHVYERGGDTECHLEPFDAPVNTDVVAWLNNDCEGPCPGWVSVEEKDKE